MICRLLKYFALFDQYRQLLMITHTSEKMLGSREWFCLSTIVNPLNCCQYCPSPHVWEIHPHLPGICIDFSSWISIFKAIKHELLTAIKITASVTSHTAGWDSAAHISLGYLGMCVKAIHYLITELKLYCKSSSKVANQALIHVSNKHKTQYFPK